MTDIVERLREFDAYSSGGRFLFREAADEIERLRAEIGHLRWQLEKFEEQDAAEWEELSRMKKPDALAPG